MPIIGANVFPSRTIAGKYVNALMSIIANRPRGRGRGGRRFERPTDDPRVARSRSAAFGAARTLFLSKGYVATTMEDIAVLAGLTKRTLYNNFSNKQALFTQIVAETIAYADEFARGLRNEFTVGIAAVNLPSTLDDIGRRLALVIMRPEVIALRRLLIGEAREFPDLAARYFDQVPGQVLEVLAAGFEQMERLGLLRLADSRQAAAQFAYLVVGAPLDRAVLTGTLPLRQSVIDYAREGVLTFLARYRVTPAGRGPKK